MWSQPAREGVRPGSPISNRAIDNNHLNLSMTQFSHLENGYNFNSLYLMGLL